MKKSVNITEAEWPIMLVLWEKRTATAAEIVAEATRDRDVSMRTIKTLLRRLIAKKLVDFTVDPGDARIYHYRPLIEKADAVKAKRDSFVEQIYQNDVGELLTHFVEQSGLTEEELNRLQEIVRKKIDSGQSGRE